MDPTRRTLADLTARLSRPESPLITYYNQRTGERVETSATTIANWVAKTSNFLVDELDAEPDTRIRLGFESHWLRFVWILSAWNVGASIVASQADIGVSGPELHATEPHRVAVSLLPLGAPFAEGPAGFLDMAAEVPTQGDHFVALDPPQPQTVAVDLATVATHEQLIAAASPDQRRLLFIADQSRSQVQTAQPPAQTNRDDLQRDIEAIINACLGGGSLVIVAGADQSELIRLADQEGAELSGTIY